jgi:PKD repeat protein
MPAAAPPKPAAAPATSPLPAGKIVTPPKKTDAVAVDPLVKEQKKVSQAKRVLLLLFTAAYTSFVLWSLILLLVLPSAEDSLRKLIPFGLLTSAIAAFSLLALGGFLFMRVTKSDSSVQVKQMSLIKIGFMVLPGLLIAGIVPLTITREPGLSLVITNPKTSQELIAPLSVTISAATAAETLTKLNLRPIKYQWDTNGDGKMDQETVEPNITTIFDRAGVYVVSASVLLDSGQKRSLAMRLTIPVAVFSTSPLEPVVERPVKFSIEHLLTDPKLLTEVTWNFGDAGKEETVKSPDIVHTYFTTDTFTVTATVKFTNNTQQVFTRKLTVVAQPPLPFAVTLSTEPKTLVGPAPLGVVFTAQTNEDIKDIQWDFSDGQTEPGKDLRRVSHLFSTPGIYPVTVRLRNADGKIAELSTLVRATENLQLSDLRFEGQPEVSGAKIQGEVPLTVDLTPKTSQPLVQFSWEDADGPVAPGATGTAQFQRVYRKEGTYSLILIAEDAEGKAMRMPITVQVNPPLPDPEIVIRPEGGPAPLLVDFDASSTFVPPGQQIAGFEWQFGDEANSQNPCINSFLPIPSSSRIIFFE